MSKPLQKAMRESFNKDSHRKGEEGARKFIPHALLDDLDCSVPTYEERVVDPTQHAKIWEIPVWPPLCLDGRPHHWICGDRLILREMPEFFHEHGPSPSGAEWNVCCKCEVARGPVPFAKESLGSNFSRKGQNFMKRRGLHGDGFEVLEIVEPEIVIEEEEERGAA